MTDQETLDPIDNRVAVPSAILDDFESRPGTVTSLSRTVLGAFVLQQGGWISISNFTEIMSTLGISSQSTRTAVNRLKTKGILRSENNNGRAGYRLTDEAEDMLVRGFSRVFNFRQMQSDEPWRIISFSIPEPERASRHRLRRRLTAIGCGTVTAGLLICPDYHTAEVDAIVSALNLDMYVTTFAATDISAPTDLITTAAQWWDLEDIRSRHLEFIKNQATQLEHDANVSAETFARFVFLLDEWRVIPLLDPGLPASLLPDEWPGRTSLRIFDDATQRLFTPAREWLKKTVEH